MNDKLIKEGICRFNRGDYRSAVDVFRRAGDQPQARLFLAQSLAASGRTEEAFREFNILVERHPNFPQGHLGLAQLESTLPKLLNQASRRIIDLAEGRRWVAQQRKSLVAAMALIAERNESAERTKEADGLWERIQKIDPRFAHPGFLRFKIRRLRSRAKEIETAGGSALPTWRRLAKISGGDPEALAALLCRDFLRSNGSIRPLQNLWDRDIIARIWIRQRLLGAKTDESRLRSFRALALFEPGDINASRSMAPSRFAWKIKKRNLWLGKEKSRFAAGHQEVTLTWIIAQPSPFVRPPLPSRSQQTI